MYIYLYHIYIYIYIYIILYFVLYFILNICVCISGVRDKNNFPLGLLKYLSIYLSCDNSELTRGGHLTLCSRRARFCCCSMRSEAEAGGEAALMLLMTRILSSGRGGSLSSSRFPTLMFCSCSKPPRVNYTAGGQSDGPRVNVGFTIQDGLFVL